MRCAARKLTDKVLHFGSGSSTRIIVEFRAATPPPQGAVVNRDELRPYEITEVRKQEDVTAQRLCARNHAAELEMTNDKCLMTMENERREPTAEIISSRFFSSASG